MKQTIGLTEFTQAFQDYNRQDQFSYDALELLFNYLEEYEKDTGEEMELDVIAICCDYVEMEVEEIASQYDVEVSDCDDDEEIEEIVLEYLSDNTIVVGTTDNGVVFQEF